MIIFLNSFSGIGIILIKFIVDGFIGRITKEMGPITQFIIITIINIVTHMTCLTMGKGDNPQVRNENFFFLNG